VGTDPSADPGVVSEARAVAMLPPTSLALQHQREKSKHYQTTSTPNDPNPPIRRFHFTLNQDSATRSFRRSRRSFSIA